MEEPRALLGVPAPPTLIDRIMSKIMNYLWLK